MKVLLIILALALTVSACQSSTPQEEVLAQTCCSENATCSGTKSCSACKNCKYCKHCSKDGGTCGVCK
ncbi:MAG: hypothetical protein R2800_08375 [Flavipsychrobacter sp.]